MLEIYTSISRQFRKFQDQIDSHVIDRFNDNGYSISLEFFSGSNYTHARGEVGTPDLFFVYIEDFDDKVGAGCCKEINYALSADIPMFIVNRHGHLGILDSSITWGNEERYEKDPNDYRNHRRISCQIIDWDDFFNILNYLDNTYCFTRKNNGKYNNWEKVVAKAQRYANKHKDGGNTSSYTDELLLLIDLIE